MLTDFTIITRSLKARRFSTITTALTVAVAVGLMLTLLSMRDAGRQAFERGSGNMHLLVSADQSPLASVLNGVFYANAPARSIAWAKYQQIASDPRVDFAVPIQQGDSFRGFPVLATRSEFFTKFQPQEGQAWRFASGKAFDNEYQVVLGSAVARATSLKVGAKIVLTHGTASSREGSSAGREGSGATGASGASPAHEHGEFKFKVVGVLEATGSSHDRAAFVPLESAWAIHAFDRIERAQGGGHDHDHDHAHDDHDHGHDHAHDDHDHDPEPPKVEVTDADRLITGIYLRLVTRAGSSVSAILPTVASELRRDPTLTVASPTSEVARLFSIVSNIDEVFVGIAAVVMVSSSIAIMLALYNSMDGRRRQIAIVRVLGCSRGRVFGLIVTESAIIGVIGALMGVALSFAGSWLVAAALKERVGVVVQPSITPEWVIVVCFATVALGAIAGILPGFLAYRTGVANTLKPAA